MKKDGEISGKKILKKVSKKLKQYDKLSYGGQFAMFMGKVQLLEINLRRLLVELFDYKWERIEKWTLGQLTTELDNNKLRPDFIHLLKSLVERRNYVAHELLADELISQAILGSSKFKKHYSKELRFLHKSIFELEQVMLIYRLTNKHGSWK